MSNRTLRVRLGAFVLLAFILLGVLIVIFGSLPGLFRPSNTYYVRFADAPGLTAGSPVRRSGVRIGEVRDIILDEERGIVRVKIAINAPYRIRASEQPTLVTGVLGSDASIDLIPRPVEDEAPVDREPLDPGAELVGVRAATVNTLLQGARDVVPTTQQTLNDIRKSMQRLEKLAARVEKSVPLADETMRAWRDLATDSRKLVPQLEKSNAEIAQFARAGREAIPEIQKAAESIRLFTQEGTKAIPEIRVAVKEVGEFARAGREVLPEIQKATEEFRALATDARRNIPKLMTVIEDIGDTARKAGRLAEDADVLLQGNRERINRSMENLDKTLARTVELLKDENLRNVERILNNGSDASRSAADILEQGRTTVRQLNGTLKLMDETLRDVQRATKPFGDRSGAILTNTEKATVTFNQTMLDIQQFMKALDRSNGSFRKFITDASLYNNLDAAAAMIPKMIPRLERILKDFEIFADKLARHPESIGVRGAISPGSGLKNPPTPPISSQPPVIFTPHKN